MKASFIKVVSAVLAAVSLLRLQVEGLSRVTGERSGPEGLEGYRRFHANDSYIGTPIPCSFEEKLCFRYNTLYNPTSGRCLPEPSDFCEYAGDRHEFLYGSNRLFARCPGYEDPCPGYRMAFDGRCYTKETVRDVICGCDAEPTKHFLGGVECRCSPPSLVHVEQPRGRGRCRVPDLRFPDHKRSLFYENLFKPRLPINTPFNCSERQRRCFAVGKVWVQETRGCFYLNTIGPCAEGYVVTLRKDHITEPAVCMQLRSGCRAGEIRMAFDGKCHWERNMRIIAPQEFKRNLLGEYQTSVNLYLPDVKGGSCVYWYTGDEPVKQPSVYHPRPYCAGDDFGLCSLYEIEMDVPLPM